MNWPSLGGVPLKPGGRVDGRPCRSLAVMCAARRGGEVGEDRAVRGKGGKTTTSSREERNESVPRYSPDSTSRLTWFESTFLRRKHHTSGSARQKAKCLDQM